MADEKEKKVTESKPATKKAASTKAAEAKKEVKAAENKKESKEVKTTETKSKTAKATVAKTAETKTTTAKAEKTTKTAAKTTAKKEVKVKAEEELVAKATVKYERISSRKVAVVADLIRGKKVDEAMAILKFTPKAGAEVLVKLLKSAIANAENNNAMDHSKLYIAEIYSNQGPTLKRIRPAAKGSAVRIRKRTSHTTIVLKESK